MSAHDFEFKSIDGKPMKMSAFAGKPVLVVNTASKCGLTPQYAGLQALAEKYRDRLVVLGVPSNDFGGQEPGSEAEIASFCSTTYDVTFPMFAKVDVNGAGTHPLFALLKSARPGALGTEAIKWNFTKFLVSATGEVVKRYAPQTSPEDIDADVAAQLGASR